MRCEFKKLVMIYHRTLSSARESWIGESFAATRHSGVLVSAQFVAEMPSSCCIFKNLASSASSDGEGLRKREGRFFRGAEKEDDSLRRLQ